MSQKKTEKFTDRLARLFSDPKIVKVLDSEDEPEEEWKEQAATDEESGRLDRIEAQVQELTVAFRQLVESRDSENKEPAEDEDPSGRALATPSSGAKKTTDARTVDADTASRAAVLYPGIRVADSDGRCAVMRVALRHAMKDKVVDEVVRSTLRGASLDGCDRVTLDAAFLAASEVVKARNNLRTTDALAKASSKDFGHAVSPAEINRMNREYHAKKGA